MAKKRSTTDKLKALGKNVDDLKKKWGPSLKKGQDFLLKEEKEVEQYVKAHPMKSVGVAFAVGFLLGRMGR